MTELAFFQTKICVAVKMLDSLNCSVAHLLKKKKCCRPRFLFANSVKSQGVFGALGRYGGKENHL